MANILGDRGGSSAKSLAASPTVKQDFWSRLISGAGLPGWMAYLIAVVVTLGMLVLRLNIDVIFGQRPLLILFVLPIIISAHVGGLGPGLLSTALAAFCVEYFLIPPAYSLGIKRGADLTQWFILILNGVLISALNEALHRWRRQAEAGRGVLSVTLTSIGDGLISTDLAGRVAFMNPVAENLTGWSQEEALGRPLPEVFQIINELTGQPVDDPVGKVLASGLVVGLANHTLLVARDGRRTPIADSAAPIKGADGGTQGVVLVFRDCTEQKAAEDALRASEQRLRLALESAQAGTWEWDLRTNQNTWSEELWGLYGLEPHSCEPSYQAWAKTIHPNDREAVTRHVEAAARRGDDLAHEWRLAQDGRWLMARGRPLRDESGQPVRYIGIVVDITDRKKTEEELRRWADAFRYCSHGIAIGNPHTGNADFCNPAFARLHHCTLEEVSGRPIISFYHPSEHEHLRQCVEECDHAGFVSYESLMVRADGSTFPVQMELVAVHDETGEFLYRVATAQDITARKQAEEEKARLDFQLRQAQKMEAIGTLAGGIAHDFNNILGAIMGYTELAQELAQGGQDSRQELDQVLRAAERARDLVRQILTFSRKVESNRQPISLDQTVSQALAMLGRTLPKMVEIQTSLRTAPQMVQADPTQVEVVVMNLLTNAADAMPEGGKITIATALEEVRDQFCLTCNHTFSGSFLTITVSDTGQGMEDATRDRVFEPFFTTKEVGKGTGLGLSTVFGIVAEHDGHIQCISQPGQGTTFKIFLPLHPEEQAGRPRELAPPAQSAPGIKATVLLVDDDEALRTFAARALAAKGYGVVTAASGEEALEIYRAQGEGLACVVMDLGMPGMGGHECLKRLLALDPRVKVIIASGYGAGEQVKAASKDGAVGYVPKPFRQADLVAAVEDAIKA